MKRTWIWILLLCALAGVAFLASRMVTDPPRPEDAPVPVPAATPDPAADPELVGRAPEGPAPRPELDEGGHTLRTRVVDADGNGLQALVTLLAVDAARGYETAPTPLRAQARTDAEGRLLFSDLSAGAIGIDVEIEDRIQRRFFARLPHSDELVLRVFDPNGATVHGTAKTADGVPVGRAGITVEARQTRADEPPGATATTTTAEDGTWRIANLPPVVLEHVKAEAAGYRVVHVKGNGRRLPAGGELFVPVVLYRGATVAGVVTDRARKPLAGAQVRAHVFARGGGTNHDTTSDAEGRFQLAALLPGGIQLSAYLDGYFQPSQMAGEVKRKGAETLMLQHLADGEEREIHLVLLPGIPVAGRVVDGEGRAVANARVEASGSVGTRARVSGWSADGRFETETADDGTFRFAGLAPNEIWSFRAEAGGAIGVAEFSDPLTDAGVPEVRIVLRPGATIAGQIVDAAGEPVPHATLTLQPGWRQIAAASDGTWRFEDLAAGAYDIQVRDRWDSVDLGSVDSLAVDWGQIRNDVRIEVGTPLVVAGSLVDAAGEPVPNAALRFETRKSRGPKGFALTNGAGRFALALWDPGPYRAHHGEQAFLNSITPPDSNVELVLGARGDDVTFRIVSRDGSPAPNARIVVRSGEGSDATSLRQEVEGGILVLPRHQLPAPTFVEVDWARSESGKRLNLRDFALQEVDTTGSEVVFTLEPGRVLRGTVTTPDGKPLADVGVSARPPGSRHAEGGRTDAAGNFEAFPLPEGALEVNAFGKKGEFLPSEAVLVAPDQETVHLELVKGVSFVVLVLGPDGEGVASVNVTVLANREGKRWARHGRTDDTGSCRLGGLAADATFSITTRTPGFPESKMEDVPYGSGAATIHLVAGTKIQGSVVDETGKPVARASVTAKPLDAKGAMGFGRTEGDTNRFALGALNPGRYELKASAHGRFAPSKPVVVTAPAKGVRMVVRRIQEVVGRVSGDHGRAVGSWWVGGSMTSVTIEPDGSFTVPRTADDPGSLLVRNDQTGECAFLENVKPSDGPFDLTLRPGKTIAGRIEGYADRGGKRVHLGFVRGPIRWGGTIETDGTFTQTGLPAGPWRVEVRMDGKGTGVEIEAGRTDVVLMLPE